MCGREGLTATDMFERRLCREKVGVWVEVVNRGGVERFRRLSANARNSPRRAKSNNRIVYHFDLLGSCNTHINYNLCSLLFSSH